MAQNKNIKIGLDYSDFVGGVSECQRKMQILTNEFKLQTARMGENASEADVLSLAEETLSQKISLQEQIVDAAMAKWDAMCESEEATLAQTERAHIAYQKQAEILQNMRNGLESTRERMDELSEAEENNTEQSENSSRSFSEMASQITSCISIASTFISVLSNLGKAFIELGTNATQWADDLATTAAQIGVSTTTLQEWSYAADLVDVSVETLQGSFNKLKKNMGEVENGSTTAAEKFDALGVNVLNTDGSLRNAEDVFYECIDALGGIANESERDAAAMEIFGKSATTLNTLIEAGSGTLKYYGAEAENLGLVLSEMEVSSLTSMQDSFDKLSQVMDGAQRKLSAAFAPALADIAEKIMTLNPAVLEGIAAFGMVVNVVSTLTPLLQGLAAITQLSTAAKAANTVATIAETEGEIALGTAATATNVALLPQIAIAVALTAALAALFYAIYKIVEAFNEEADAADKAAASTERMQNASNGYGNSSSDDNYKQTHFALGGRTSGGSVWVGEQGAELVDLPAGSYVHNSTDSRNMSTSNNVYNVTIDAKSVDDFNKVVKVFNGFSQSMKRGAIING